MCEKQSEIQCYSSGSYVSIHPAFLSQKHDKLSFSDVKIFVHVMNAGYYKKLTSFFLSGVEWRVRGSVFRAEHHTSFINTGKHSTTDRTSLQN